MLANTFLTGNSAHFAAGILSVLFVLMELFVASILRPIPIPAYAVLGQIASFLGCQRLKLDANNRAASQRMFRAGQGSRSRSPPFDRS